MNPAFFPFKTSLSVNGDETFEVDEVEPIQDISLSLKVSKSLLSACVNLSFVSQVLYLQFMFMFYSPENGQTQ